MQTFKQFLSESRNDKGIFKAVFIIGIPGAGKSYVSSKITGTISPRIVNTDRAIEFLSKKTGTTANSESWSFFEDSIKKTTKESLAQFLNGALPLFVDGTSNDASNILRRIGILESLGYDVGIVHVKTSLETAKARAEERGRKIKRHVDPEFIETVYDLDQDNAAFLKNKVNFFMEVNNDDGELTEEMLLKAFKKAQSFFADKQIHNPVGQRLLAQMEEQNEAYLSPEIIPLEQLRRKVDGWYK